MSYEKVKIIGVRQATKKDTGQIMHFLQVEHLKSYDIYMSDTALKQMPIYEKAAGKEALIPVSWGEYNGSPSMSLIDDCVPLPAPVRNQAA